MKIDYTVKLHNPHAHLFRVQLKIEDIEEDILTVSLPNWIPGSYMIRDFAKNIVTLKAISDTGELQTTKLDKNHWQIAGISKSVMIEYDVYAWDLSVRSAHLDMTHAFFNGTSLFLAVNGYENLPVTVELQQSDNAPYNSWRVATSLKSVKTNISGFGQYQASNYDDLIDHPVEIGTHAEFSFTVENTPHRMTLTGIQNADIERIKSDLVKICQQHCDMFNELPDIAQYIFLVMVVGDGYGGLEHRSSTSLLCSRDDLPSKKEPADPDEKYRNFLGLCSHEYFHTWNVKRIKPAVFQPYDLDRENYTRQLWAFEGITSYYDELALVRSGVISVNSYLELLGQTITRVIRGTGRHLQSVAESSFDAWTKFYKQDESAPNTIVSYYAKGALIALALDLTIRRSTENKKSLDDVMRYLWQNYGKKGKGLEEGEIEKIASDISGCDLQDFFNRYLYGTEDLPLDTLLNDIGIRYHLRPTINPEDKGGKPGDKSTSDSCSLGVRLASHSQGAKITHVFSGQSAEEAGLAAGDIIIAINHLQTDKSKIDKMLQQYQAGDEITVHAFRRDELHTFTITLKQAELTTCYLQIDTKATDTKQYYRRLWLNT